MSKINPFTVLCAITALGFGTTAPAAAAPGETQTVVPRSAQAAPEGRNRNRRERAPTPPTAEENLAAAQVVATSASPGCQVTGATLLGQTETGPMYEATCATGPGYILVASTPPQAIDCVQLGSSARVTRERDPAADVGIQCTTPANIDVVPVIAAYAQSTGVTCTIDDALSVGKAANGNLVYEVGCADQDGYWLEQTGTTFTRTDCLQVVSQNGTCRFTTPQEQAASVKAMLAGPAAPACDVQQARYMGTNDRGTFYEAKCAVGDGYIIRVDAEKALQQTYPCATSAKIGGGCTLTPATPTAEATTPAAE